MFKNPSVKDMVLLQNFVREPVDTICKNINNNFSKKIIITGGRGVGKTTILYNNELLGLGTDNQTIYMSFDAVGMNVLTPGKYFNEKFMIHYYEVIMSYKILNYIKNNYGLTYEKYFKKYEIIITKFLNNIDNYIEKSIYEKVYLKKYLNPGELSGEIIQTFKDCLGLKKLNVSIDRFDWTNTGSSKSQETLSKYFDIFDKAIITTDDKELIEENNRTKLQEKGYVFIDVDYGKDLDVVRQIIKRRINYYIKNRYNTFSEEQLTNKIYRKLIDETNGNINLMFSILDKTDSILHWKREQFDMKEDIKDAINEELNNEIEYQKIIKPRKLYL